MACPTNRETIKNGIINQIKGLLVIRTGTNQINERFGEQIVDQEGNINPSEELLDKYLAAHEAQQEKNNIVSSLMEITQPKVSEAQNEKVRQALFDMGVKVETLVVDGEVEGIALPLQALVAYTEGKQDVLPEEAFHIATELVSQTNPGLFGKMLTAISSLPIYQSVLEQYSSNPQYQKDGKPDLLKLKKEAIGKQLANQMVQEPTVKNLWDKFVTYLRTLFSKTNVNLSPFQDTLDLVFNNKVGNVRNNLLRNKSYLISQGIPNEIADQMISLANSNLTDDELRLHIAQIAPENAYYSLSDKAKTVYDRLNEPAPTGTFKDSKTRIAEKAYELFGDINSKPYKDLISQFEPSNLKSEAINILRGNTTPSFLSQESFDLLKEQIDGKLAEFSDSQILIQKEIASTKTGQKVTPDLMVVDNKGTVHLFNFFSEIPNNNTEAILNSELAQARNILRDNYRVNAFGQERTFVYPMEDAKNIALNDEQDSKFFSIPTRLDSTGSAKVDDLIRSLYTKAGETNDAIRTQIFKAVSAIQLQGSLSPLINIVKTLNKRVDTLLENYDASKPEEFTQETAKLLTFTDFFKDSGNIFREAQKENPLLFKDSAKQIKVLRELSAKLNNSKDDLNYISRDIVNNIAQAKNIEGILQAEKSVTFWAKWFNTLSEGKTAATQLLQRTWAEIVQRSDVATNTSVKKLQKVYEEYSKKYKGLQPIAQKDDKGNYVHKLIEKYDRARFNKELALAQERNDIQWVKDNVDYSAYRTWFEKERDEHFAQIDDTIYDYKEEENKKIQEDIKNNWLEKYDISKNISSTNFELPKYISTKFISKEYQELSKDAIALSLHSFIYDLNQEAYEAGAITKLQAETLIPFVRKQTLERLATGGSVSLLDNTLRGLLTTEEMEQYSNIDPETGRERESLPFYFTKDISKDGNYKDVSQDIFKILPDYIRQIKRYELLEEKLPEMRLLQEVETSKESLATNGWGNRIEGKENIKNNATNTEYFNNFLKATFFAHRNISNTTDTAIIETAGKARSAINNWFGREIISEQGGKIGLYQTVDAANRLFTLKVLGLNLSVPIANTIGGNLQALINTSKYFDRRDFIKHEFSTLTGKFSNSEEWKKTHALTEYFQFLYEGQVNERLSRKMSMNAATAYSIPERLMQLQHKSEVPLQLGIGMAMLDNMMVSGDKIVSIKEYVNEKYADRFDKPEAERKAIEEKMEVEISSLKATKALSKTITIKGDEVTLEGLERDSQAVIDFSTLVKQQVRRVTGGGNREDMRQINMTILGRSVMVFKSWMPRLISNRIQKLTWNEGLQEYEMGRWNAVGQLLHGNWIKGAQRLYDVYQMNDRGVALLKERYEDTKASYEFENPGKTFRMTKAQYISMVQDLVKQETREVLALSTIMLTFFAVGSMKPPEDPEQKNAYNYAYKLVGKVKDEIGFFYSPGDWSKTLGSSVFPAVGVVSEALGVGKDVLKTIKYKTTGDEELEKKTHLFKKVAKFTPILNQGTAYLALFDAELAKELQLEIKKDNGSR